MKLKDRGKRFWATLGADLQRYVGSDCRPWGLRFFRRLPKAVYEHPAMIAVVVYRYGQWIAFRCRVPIVRQLLDAHYYYLYHLVRTRLQIEVPRTTAIGPGMKIDHFGLMIVNSGVVAGRNLWLKPGVIIGQTERGVPKLGDNVEVGVGAKILGGVTVGDDAIVGAQSVVVKDVPSGAIVAGVPAKIIRVREAASAIGEP